MSVFFPLTSFRVTFQFPKIIVSLYFSLNYVTGIQNIVSKDIKILLLNTISNSKYVYHFEQSIKLFVVFFVVFRASLILIFFFIKIFHELIIFLTFFRTILIHLKTLYISEKEQLRRTAQGHSQKHKTWLLQTWRSKIRH